MDQAFTLGSNLDTYLLQVEPKLNGKCLKYQSQIMPWFLCWPQEVTNLYHDIMTHHMEHILKQNCALWPDADLW